MIVFNTKAMVSNFILPEADRRLFDIHSTVDAAELYQHLLDGTEGEEAEIEQYNTAETPSTFAGTFDGVADQRQAWTSNSLYGSYASAAIRAENIKETRQFYLSHPQAEEMARLYYGFAADSRSERVFGNFEQRDVVREELIRHLADALCIPPELAFDTERTLEQKQAIGRDMNRLRWFFADNALPVHFQNTPPLEQVEMYQTWTPAERNLVNGSVFAPQQMLDIACAFKRDNPNKILTPDTLDGRAFQTQVNADFENRAREAFVAKWRRAPRVLNEYLRAQVAAGNEDVEDIANKFSLDSLKAVAQLGSEALYALVPYIDFSKIKADQIAYLATHIRELQLKDLVSRGFGAWYAQHRGDPTPDLTELLSTIDLSKVNWDTSKTAREIINETVMAKYIRDCHSYERQYHYRFADNCTAIRGKEIVVKDHGLKMYMMAPDDYRNFAMGDATHCCQHWGGAGESCVWKYTTDPFAACVIIEKAGKVVAQGFVFTDEVKDTFVFDNMEFANDRNVADFKNIIATYVDALPYQNVHLGAGYTEATLLSWGKSIEQCGASMAHMPTTIGRNPVHCGWGDSSNNAVGCDIYSDYHRNARVFKKDGAMLIPKGSGEVFHGPVEPTPWDALRDSDAKFIINDYEIPAAERQAMATMGEEDIRTLADSVHMRAHYLRDPSIASGLPAIPEEWQRAALAQQVLPRLLAEIKNPIPEVRDRILEWMPEKIVEWPDATEAQWLSAVRQKPALAAQYPGEMTSELALTAFHSGGIDALSYIPVSLIPTAELSGIVSMSPRVILSFENPSDELVQLAVSREPYLISALPVLSEQVGIVACHVKPSAVLLWPDAPDDVVRGCIEREPFLIRNYAHLYPELREVAIRSNPDSVWHIPGATDEEKALALQLKNGEAQVTRSVT